MITKYLAGSAGSFAAAASTAPFAVIQGSSTRTIRVKKITVQGPTLTAVAYLDIVATKYSTAVSGGTATALTAVPTDSSFAAATANIINVYTAAPTAGTAVGTIANERTLGQATTAAATGTLDDTTIFDFGSGIPLRGIAEGIGVRFTSAPATAVTLVVTIEFEEE